MRSFVHILVGVVFRDAMTTLGATLDSLFQQRPGGYRLSILLVDDGSTDAWRDTVGARLQHPCLHLRRIARRSAAGARNFVLDEAERAFGDADYIARLDADDTLHGPDVLCELAEHLRAIRPDVLLAGNVQLRDGVVLADPNRATSDLLDPKRLLERLARMANGDPSAELPSCNTVVRCGLSHRYPMVPSAEDHWYMTELIMDQCKLHIHVAHELLYAAYGLRGGLTLQNELNHRYLESRRALLLHARERLTRKHDDE